jgi:hypothetical protein
MSAIEPHVAALACFAAAWLVGALSICVMLGMFPLSSRPSATRGSAGAALVSVNLLFLIVLIGWTVSYGWQELRWSSLVIVGCLGLLFAPALFEAWPARWRDSRAGLGLLAVGQAVAFSGLALAPRGA